MFKKLFGGGSSGGPAQPTKAAPVDPQQTIDRLQSQVTMIDKRIVVMENNIKDCKTQALQKKKAGDTRGAVLQMKKVKMYEGELTKLDGQQVMLTQQQMQIQSTHSDVDVVNTLKAGNQAVTNMNSQMDVDSIAELQDDMAENADEVAARNELFAAAAEEGKEDLLGELDELEAEMVELEMQEMDVNAAPITGLAAAPQPVPAQAAAAQEQQQSAQLAAMMM